MDIKKTLQKLFISLILSPVIFYIFYGIASIAGASYEMSHGDTFIVWLLMAIVINLSMTRKEG